MRNLEKRSNLMESCFDVLYRTSNLVISRRCFLGNVKQRFQKHKTHVQGGQHVQKLWSLLIIYANLWLVAVPVATAQVKETTFLNRGWLPDEKISLFQ